MEAVRRSGVLLLFGHRAASRVLGVHVGWRDIPAREDKYVLWCRARGMRHSRPTRPNDEPDVHGTDRLAAL